MTTQELLAGDLDKVSAMLWQSAKLQRVCRSSAAAETRAAVDAEDELFAQRFQAFVFLNLFDRLSQTVFT